MEQTKQNKYSFSEGLASWLEAKNLSIAFTSYDSGFLFLIGSKAGGISINYRQFGRAMGLCYHNKTLFLAADNRIYELENDGQDGEQYDAVFVPRRSNFVGGCDIHEIAVNNKGEILFANTAFSCVAKLSKTKTFEIVWKPEFITKIANEDRCHLNGIGLNEAGELAVVSYCRKSDTFQGWRGNRDNGGAIADLNFHKPFDCLSMPHSPRIWKDKIAFLDSGRGFLVYGSLVFIPGFIRGLCFVDKYAIVTSSLPREGCFHGLELQENLENRGGNPVCGIFVINTETGSIDNWLKIEGPTRELFDCCVLPNIKCPSAIAPGEPSLLNRITFAISGELNEKRKIL